MGIFNNLNPMWRTNNQLGRVQQGVQSGALTSQQAANFSQRDANIQRTIQNDRFQNGGTLTPGERVRIEGRLNRLSGDIFRAKNPGAPFPGTGGTPSTSAAPVAPISPSQAPTLSTNPTGWPTGTVQTPGGYNIVPQGNTQFSIYGPGQSPNDTPLTQISGDPHVAQQNGGAWSFSQNSSFDLPDGTQVAALTSAQTGNSVTTGLNITNGSSQVQVVGVDGTPTTGSVSQNSGSSAGAGMNNYNLGPLGNWGEVLASGQPVGVVLGSTFNALQNTNQTITPGGTFTG